MDLSYIYASVALGCISLGIFIFWTRIYSLRPVLMGPQFSQTRKLDSCCTIIAGKLPSGEENLLSPLESRAIPNDRLKIAFGISNTFTSTDEEQAKQFVTEARKLINLKPRTGS